LNNYELRTMWKDAVVAYLRYCTCTECTEESTNKTSGRIADIPAKILTRDLPNMKEHYLYYAVKYLRLHSVEIRNE
jgi:hypothetical protein